jgi:hypothetical protein
VGDVEAGAAADVEAVVVTVRDYWEGWFDAAGPRSAAQAAAGWLVPGTVLYRASIWP